MRRVRSGLTQAGISSWGSGEVFVEGAITDCVDDLREVRMPLVGAGVGVVFEIAAGDMVGWCWFRERDL
jgi:hypothetical protein